MRKCLSRRLYYYWWTVVIISGCLPLIYNCHVIKCVIFSVNFVKFMETANQNHVGLTCPDYTCLLGQPSLVHCDFAVFAVIFIRA